MDKDEEIFIEYIQKGNYTHHRCINYKSKNCRSKAITDSDGKVVKKTGHNDRCRHFRKRKEKFIKDTNLNLENLDTMGKDWKLPEYDPLLHAYLQDSIHKAFHKKDIIFNDELVLNNLVIPEEYLKTIQTLPNKEDEEAFKKFKTEYSKNMYFGPLKLEWKIPHGYVIKATSEIKRNTLLCEYTGEVLRKTEDLFSDDLMEYATFDGQEYVIVPIKQGNIGRFFSGINNKTGHKKQNVRSIKFRIGNNIHIALYTIKHIKEGELLYYNYNQCGKLSKHNGMDTSYYK